jgi:hypothetical protein
MQTTEAYLGLIRERSKRGLPLERVYRQLFNRNLYLTAYGKIYRNVGSMTPGVTDETADAMSLGKIDSLIETLRFERYQWKPARRTYIPKKTGHKKRPLGMPVWSDKRLAEVVQRFKVVDNSDNSPTRLTAWETLLLLPLERSSPSPHFSNSEDRYGPSCVRVPARVLSHPLSGAALAFFLAPSSAFPLQSRSCAHHGAPPAQATHPTGLPFLPSRLHSLAECETCLCESHALGMR